jgi:hypothetical protein
MEEEEEEETKNNPVYIIRQDLTHMPRVYVIFILLLLLLLLRIIFMECEETENCCITCV